MRAQPGQSHFHSRCRSLRQSPRSNLCDWILWVLRSRPTASALSQVSFPSVTEFLWLPCNSLHLKWFLQNMPDVLCSQGKKTTCFCMCKFTARQEALMWLLGIALCHLLFTVLWLSLFGTLWNTIIWNFFGCLSIPISFCSEMNMSASHKAFNFGWGCSNVVKISNSPKERRVVLPKSLLQTVSVLVSYSLSIAPIL